MSVRERVRWDARYRDLNAPYPDPDPLLFQFTPPAAPLIGETAEIPLYSMPFADERREARALDLAAGVGQNGLWLASQGYSVDLLDISREALRRAQSEAGKRGLRRVNFLQVDLDEAALQSEAYDVVCVFRYFQREVFPRIRACVRPGGRVIYQTFHTGYLREYPTFNPAFLAEVGELGGYFSDWQLLKSSDDDIQSQVVAIRP
jgi:2-polyprenyl-3-methyl-5-hydroxy-6-metoxy-1,4-benzoquinol methylase